MKLLHLDSSILGENSASRALSASIVARWRQAAPGLEVMHRDLAGEHALPHLLHIAQISHLRLAQASSQPALRQPVPDATHPFIELWRGFNR